MAVFQVEPWHDGEVEMQKAMKVTDLDNPTVPQLSQQLAHHLQIAPLIALGTLDASGRPWTTLLGGEKPMSQSLGNGIIGIRTAVTGKHDPVVEELVGKEATGNVVREEGRGRMVSGLTIDLETRKRVKLFGRMIAGALMKRGDEVTGKEESIVEMQVVLKIEQSLGNCPKYLNKKHITPSPSKPSLLSESIQLPQQAVDLIAKSDLFFVSSANADHDMDTNHRGGPPGFLRVASNTSSGAVLCWPEYSGNRFYQTLGNLRTNPVAGICVPDFDTGDMLYLTGTTEIHVGEAASKVLPKSNLCVTLTITASRFISSALPFRGTTGDRSPYNPVVRYHISEKPALSTLSSPHQQGPQQHATLLSQTPLTPTISRFRFSLSNNTPATSTPGQYVTLDFSDHLDIGYSHMRDDDPRSINDDFIRTFTVSSSSSSSAPSGHNPNPLRKLSDDEFEITVRKVGAATGLLFKYGLPESRGWKLEVGVKGFGGEFEVRQENGEEKVGFIAAGVGITPLLPSLAVEGRGLDLQRLEVLWSVRKEDLGLVEDVVDTRPEVIRRLKVFVTNAEEGEEKVEELRGKGVRVEVRRMRREDVELGEGVKRYYLCTAVPMRKQLMEWLEGKEMIFEDFNF